MAKYDALRVYLASRPVDEERMTFGEVERLIGRLPDSAREHRAWWGNDDYKSQSIAWRDAGWHVESVDQRAGTVVFARGTTGSTPRTGSAKFSARGAYIDSQVIAAIKAKGGSDRFDQTKLLRLIDELNDNYLRGNGYAAHAVLRAILDHVPPLLSCTGFAAAVNNYPWNRTDKAYMRKLLDFKMQADDALHRQITATPDLLTLDDMPSRAWVNRLLQECANPPNKGA
jgi:hypothetical protein